jgi:hypothetical protein
MWFFVHKEMVQAIENGSKLIVKSIDWSTQPKYKLKTK